MASFAAKADRSVDGQRLYTDPLAEITDQVGLRVITFLRDDVSTVANLLGEEMQLLDDRDMGQETASTGRWGYASRHLLVAVAGEQQPASIQVRMRLRECSGNSCASARSSRMPANSAGMVSARRAPAAASGL